MDLVEVLSYVSFASEFILPTVGMKVSESVKNQPRLPRLLEKSDIDSSDEHDKQMINDSGVSPDSKNNSTAKDMDSGSPASAHPSIDNSAASAPDSVCESDLLLARNGTTVIKFEVENKQEEPLTSSKPPKLNESNNMCENENQLLDPPSKCDINSSVEHVTGNTCKTESHCLKSACGSYDGALIASEASGNPNPLPSESAKLAGDNGNIGSPVKVSEDGDSQAIVENADPGFEASAQNTIGKVNGGQIASFPTRVVTEKNVEASSLGVSGEEVAERISENQNPSSVSAFPESGENVKTSKAVIDDETALQERNEHFIPGVAQDEAVKSS